MNIFGIKYSYYLILLFSIVSCEDELQPSREYESNESKVNDNDGTCKELTIFSTDRVNLTFISTGKRVQFTF